MVDNIVLCASHGARVEFFGALGRLQFTLFVSGGVPYCIFTFFLFFFMCIRLEVEMLADCCPGNVNMSHVLCVVACCHVMLC